MSHILRQFATVSPRPNCVWANAQQFGSFLDEDELVANGHLEPSEHVDSYNVHLLRPYRSVVKEAITRRRKKFASCESLRIRQEGRCSIRP